MRLNAQQFRDSPRKAVTLLGMSGVGKTVTAEQLNRTRWFHYSGDYRIGTRYLSEAILDHLKREMMNVDFLAELLRSDSIYICNNLTVSNLDPVIAYLGKPGNPEQGGLPLEEFQKRLKEHHDAEVLAMKDVPDFIEKAHVIYDYPHFINDAGGSLCELEDPEVFEILAEHTIILYIHAGEDHIQELSKRQASAPKPLYYPDSFLEPALEQYQKETKISSYNEIVPDDFTRWAFPRLLKDRIGRYQKIADKYGYTVDMKELMSVQNDQDFIDLVARALQRSG